MNKKYKVYWMYDNRTDTDPSTEGYIGVTTQSVAKRVRGHLNMSSDDLANNSKRSASEKAKSIPRENISYDVLFQTYNPKQAYSLEKVLRPKPNIGWNSMAGGGMPSESKPLYFQPLHKDSEALFFNTYTEVRAAGFNDGNVSQIVRGVQGKTHKGYIPRYATQQEIEKYAGN